jgi:hypothetical protein
MRIYFSSLVRMLQIKIELTRHVNALKKRLELRQIPINIDSPPPQPVPTNF